MLFERSGEDLVERTSCHHRLKVGEVVVVELSGSVPGGPAPAVALRREVVRQRFRSCNLAGFGAEIIAADVHHAGLVAVTGQQLGAKPEKAGRRYAVVPQNNTLRLLLKKPVQGRVRLQSTVQGFSLKKGENITWPIDFLYHCPRLGAALGIGGVVGAGAVGRHIQAGRPRLPKGLKYAPRRVGPSENQ